MNKLSFFDHFYQMIRKSKIIVLQNDKWYKAILNKYNKYSDFTSDFDKAFNLFIDEITVESQGTNSNFKTRIKARIKKLNSIKNQIESLNGTFESYEIINSIPSNDNYCTLAPIDLLLHQTFILKKIKDAIKFLKETIIDLQPINQKSHTKFPKIEPRINRYCDYFKNNDNPQNDVLRLLVYKEGKTFVLNTNVQRSAETASVDLPVTPGEVNLYAFFSSENAEQFSQSQHKMLVVS